MTPPDTGMFTLWFSCNYGAILTTYALYRLLEQEGCCPLVLDQAPLAHNAKWCDAASVSRAFMARHALRCSAPLRTDADLQQLNERLQTFIVGSDQVWRWRYTQAYGLLHFLDFVRGDKRKIAVSSSFGVDWEERPANSIRKAGYYLRSFDAVSVREESGLDLLRRHYGVEGEWVLDPVFLCGTDCYEELMKETEVPKKPYLLSYVLEPDEKIRHLIESIAAERGLEVINMVDAQKDFEQLRTRFGGIGNIARGVSPEQWLAYICHCAYFVTDSFHGVCFAHLFHRPFLCVAPAKRGLTRFSSLLGLTGLEPNLLPEGYTQEQLEKATRPIDWEHVQTILNQEKGRALSWLRHALSSPRHTWRITLSEIAHEVLYAGNGAKERAPQYEEEICRYIRNYNTRILPALFRLKKLWHRAWATISPGKARVYHRARLHHLRALANYLNSRNQHHIG